MSRERKHYQKAIALLLVIGMIFSSALFGCKKETYTLTYMLGEEVFATQTYEEGDTITPPEAPVSEKENFVFSAWEGIPSVMPAENVTVKAVFSFDGEVDPTVAGYYECNLEMGEGMSMKLYLGIDENGNFVFARDTDFTVTDKGAGKVYKTADGNYALVYSIVNAEGVEEGDYVAKFKVNPDGSIEFLSDFWFGGTSPNLGDGKYPSFASYAGEILKTIDGAYIDGTQIPADEEEIVDDGKGFKTGKYGGTYSTSAMGTTLKYAYTLNLKENGTYTYNVKFYIMGEVRSETENGTYKVEAGKLTLTSNSGETMSGTINSTGNATVKREVSSFSFSPVSLSFRYGYSPKVSIPETDKEEEKPEKPVVPEEPVVPGDPEDDEKTEIDPENLTSGKYLVDISWSQMAAMITPVLEVDAVNMTFDIYNQKDPAASKGTGTITEEDGVYTLNYENDKKTTFTYADGVITFTSPLVYGSTGFNNVDSDNNFVTYTAEIYEVTQPEGVTPEEPEMPDDPEDPEIPATAYIKPGKYRAVAKAMGTMDCIADLTVNEDNTYAYELNIYSEGELQITKTENGTYVIEGNEVVFTPSDESIAEWSGTVEETSVTARKSLMGMGAPTELVFTPKAEEPEQPKLAAGNYQATGTAMGSMTFVADLVINEDGTYTYNLDVSNGALIDSQNGTYAVEGNAVTFTPESGDEWSGTFEETTITASKKLLAMSSNPTELVFTPKTEEAPETPEEPQVPTLQAGEYAGTYEKTGGMGTVVYNCTLIINEDNTYEYAVNFAMMGSEIDQSESGTYTYDGTIVTFTTEEPLKEGFETSTATVDGNSLVVTRLISSFANSAEEVVVTK